VLNTKTNILDNYLKSLKINPEKELVVEDSNSKKIDLSNTIKINEVYLFQIQC